jgi:hypothetical protein
MEFGTKSNRIGGSMGHPRARASRNVLVKSHGTGEATWTVPQLNIAYLRYLLFDPSPKNSGRAD